VKRKWRQLSLRSAVLLIVLVSLAGAAWNHFVSGFHRQSRAIAELRRLGVHLQLRAATGPDWLRTAVGDKDFFEVVTVANVFPVDHKIVSPHLVLEKLRYVRSLEHLFIRGPIADADLHYISHLKTLRFLILIDSGISDEGLMHLKQLTNLRKLTLSATYVSDEGLRQLKLPHLEDFDLASPNVKGDGLRFLRNCSNLTHLYFSGKSATNEWLVYAGPPRSLTSILLYRTNVDEEGALLLENCPHLEYAKFLYSPIGETALDELVSLKELKSVWNYKTNIGPAALEQFNAIRRSMDLQPVSLLETK